MSSRKTLWQGRLIDHWKCKNALQYLSRLKVEVFKHRAYFAQFDTLIEIERAMWYFVEHHQMFNFETHTYEYVEENELCPTK